MIWGSRRSAIAELDAAIETAFLLDVKHRFHSYRLTGVVDDSLLHRPVFPAETLNERPALSLVLRGRLLVRVGPVRRWVEAGEGYVMPPHSRFGWRILEGCQGLTFSWDGALCAAPDATFFHVSEAARQALDTTTARLHDGATVTHADDVHGCAIEALGGTGLLSPAAFERTACDPAHQALTMAIDARLSNLAEEPMQIELQDELEISERHLRRLTAEVFKRYDFVDTNWAEARVRRRLGAAVAFMSNPRATTALVAREVGYHSTQAMARAFGRAGFPPPGKIRAVLAELADQ